MTEYIQVSTTMGSKEDADHMAGEVVGRRLAACAQVIGPITSTYWWRGEMERAEEWICLMKTRKELYKELEEAIRAVHPYEVPEILAVPVVEGIGSYLEWLDKEIKSVRTGSGQ